MKKVAAIGVGSTNFSAASRDRTYYDLAFDATKAALDHAGLTMEDIDSVSYGMWNDVLQKQSIPEVFLNDHLGTIPKPMTRVTTGGLTGASAIKVAWMEIASGLSDVVLVVGVEKASDLWDPRTKKGTPEFLKAVSICADAIWEYPLGCQPLSMLALTAVLHMNKYGTTEEQMAKVSVKNRRNAIHNPEAQCPMELTVDDVMSSRMICYPFKFYDCCLYSEAATAIIFASEEKANKITDKPVWLTGIGGANDYGFPGDRPNLEQITSTKIAAQRAYEKAGIKDPLKAFDVAEIYDAYTIMEIQGLEAAGFCKPGEGAKLTEEGVTALDGEVAVNPSGGAMGAGHAFGVTGVYQSAEIIRQLRGECDQRQVQSAQRGMITCLGGSTAANCLVFIFEN